MFIFLGISIYRLSQLKGKLIGFLVSQFGLVLPAVVWIGSNVLSAKAYGTKIYTYSLPMLLTTGVIMQAIIVLGMCMILEKKRVCPRPTTNTNGQRESALKKTKGKNV